MRRLSYPELTTNQTGDTHQTCSQQAEGAWLRDNDVGVTARDLGGTIEESLTSVDRQLHSHTVRVESLERPAKDTAESVVMGAVRECNQSPRHGTAEGAAEDNAVGYAVAISGDGETATCGESATVLQVAANQGAGTQSYRSQASCN